MRGTPFAEDDELLDEYEAFQEADNAPVRESGIPSREMPRRVLLKEIYEGIEIPEADSWEDYVQKIIDDPTIPF